MEATTIPQRQHVSECPLPEVPESAVFAASYVATPPSRSSHAALTPALLAFINAANALCTAAKPGAYANPSFHKLPEGLRYMLSAHAPNNGGLFAMTSLYASPDEVLAALAKLLHLPYPLVLEMDGTTCKGA